MKMSTCILKCYIYLKQPSVYTIYIIFTTSDVIFLQLFRRVGTFLFFFVFSEGLREGERERNGCVRDVASSHPHVSCLGLESVTFQFAGLRSVHWATPASTFSKRGDGCVTCLWDRMDDHQMQLSGFFLCLLKGPQPPSQCSGVSLHPRCACCQPLPCSSAREREPK